jgi:hypothetical protein
MRLHEQKWRKTPESQIGEEKEQQIFILLSSTAHL